jgi:hypothetical protein
MSKLEMLTPQNSAIAINRRCTRAFSRTIDWKRSTTFSVFGFLAKAAKDLMSFAMNGAEDRNGTLT